jgi:hypothetical protein
LAYEEFFIVEKGSSEEIDLIFPKMVSSPSPTALVVPTVSLTPKLELPWKEPHWNLYVKNPVKTDEIWARLIGTDYSVSGRCFWQANFMTFLVFCRNYSIP